MKAESLLDDSMDQAKAGEKCGLSPCPAATLVSDGRACIKLTGGIGYSFMDPLSKHLKLRREDTFLVGYLVLSAALLVLWCLLTVGRLEDDEARHYLINLYAWSDWRLLFDPWGRPGYTILASLPTMVGGELGAMLYSAFMTWLAALGGYVGARQLALPHPWLPGLILLSQPIVLATSAGSYTETTFACAITWALVCLNNDPQRLRIAALLIGWLPLTRLEGIFFLPMFGLYALWRRDVVAFLFTGVPMLGWVLITGFLSGNPLWVVQSVPYKIAQYGALRGSLGYYLNLLASMMNFPLFVAMIFGAFLGWKNYAARPWIVTSVTYYLIQEAAFMAAYGSAGYQRFLVSCAPVFSLVAWLGIQRISVEAKTKRWLVEGYIVCLIATLLLFRGAERELGIVAWISSILIVAGILHFNQERNRALPLIVCGIIALPLMFARPVEKRSLDLAVDDLLPKIKAEIARENPPIILSSTFIFYEKIGINPYTDEWRITGFHQGSIPSSPIGTLAVWDNYFAPNLHLIDKRYMQQHGYEEIHRSVHFPGLEVIVYRRESMWKELRSSSVEVSD